MTRVHTTAFRLLVASLFLWSGFAARTQAQAPAASPSPSPSPAAKPATGGGNPFAPEPAPPLPPGMTGSDTNDPRAKLTSGLYDAGEAAMGIKHLQLLQKPEAFQLGSTDTEDPKVK